MQGVKLVVVFFRVPARRKNTIQEVQFESQICEFETLKHCTAAYNTLRSNSTTLESYHFHFCCDSCKVNSGNTK